MKNLPRLAAVILGIFIFAVPSASHAWNIICGITIGMTQDSAEVSSVKWDADSRALRGIGLFYMAISELQRIEIMESEDPEIPNSLWRPNTSSTSEAIRLLADSANEIEQSLALAEEHRLGDDVGLSLLNLLRESIRSSHQAMSADNVLPDLETMHSIARLIDQYVEYGITLSVDHIEKGLKGHGTGGIPLSSN